MTELEAVTKERDDLRAAAWRVCREAFSYDDTISGERWDDYIIRQVAKLRAARKPDAATFELKQTPWAAWCGEPMYWKCKPMVTWTK